MNSQTTELMKAREVAALLGFGVATIWRYAKDGSIPSPIRIAGTTRWRRSEILAWLDEQGASQ